MGHYRLISTKSSVHFLSYSFLYLSIGLKWNQVHYYCGHLLTHCSITGWLMVITEMQLMEWMSGRGNRKYSGKTHFSVALSKTDLTWNCQSLNPGRRGGSQRLTPWPRSRPPLYPSQLQQTAGSGNNALHPYRKVLLSNLGRDTDYPDMFHVFSQPLCLEIAGQVLRSKNDSFLPNLFIP
jgi:hypothetical protein